MKSILAILLISLSMISIAKADEISFGISITNHIGFAKFKGEFNGVHPYVSYKTDDDITYSAFINSHNKIGTNISKTHWFDKDTWVDVGIITGYEAFPVLPLYRIGNSEGWLTYSPNHGGGLVHGINDGKVKF